MRGELAEAFGLRDLRPASADLPRCLYQVDLAPALLDRRPHQLSGGELQRAAIARAMVLEPAVLVLDEPGAMLDALTRAEIFALLAHFQARSRVSYVLISHDPALVASFCPRVHRLCDGRLIPG